MLWVVAERITVTNRLSPEARRGFDRACRIAGVTMTAMLEALGRELDRDPHRLLDRGSDIMELAREIDLERRHRR